MKRISRRDFLKISFAGVAGRALPQFPALPVARARTWRVTGEDVPELASFDDAFKSMMQTYDIPNGAFAFAIGNRLLLAHGYSWNDGGFTTQTDSLFRIASVSKPITAVGVLRLVQDGRLDLDAPLVDLIDLSTAHGTPDPRLGQVTVRMVLQHLGGWDRNLIIDPQFDTKTVKQALGLDRPVTIADIVAYMSGEPLQYDPGTTFSYSNYGYLLLGRVIETVSGQPYERMIRHQILAPLGITAMRLGGATRADRLPNEVEYFSTASPTPYEAFDMRVMEAAGGWVGSAVDLVRFGALHHRVLDETHRAIMLAPPLIGRDSSDLYYGCGWEVMVGSDGAMISAWHDGGIRGSVAIMAFYVNGVAWAAVFNQTEEGNPTPYLEILVQSFIAGASQVSSWPEGTPL
jgi:CubicO group peptidase (beta-lactamase class C family)